MQTPLIIGNGKVRARSFTQTPTFLDAGTGHGGSSATFTYKQTGGWLLVRLREDV